MFVFIVLKWVLRHVIVIRTNQYTKWTIQLETKKKTTYNWTLRRGRTKIANPEPTPKKKK